VSAQGACITKQTKCETSGGYCAHFLDKCKSGYEGGPPEDCPLGKSAQCCLPSVTVTTDRQGYQSTDTIQVTLTNNTKASVFVGGCSVFHWESKDAYGVWTVLGPNQICVWEGYAGEVKAGATHVESLPAKHLGTLRLGAGYGIGCASEKPLSQAGCAVTGTALSPSFVVKSCPSLVPPMPAACAGGRWVPRYDAEKICITSYSCVPCDYSDPNRSYKGKSTAECSVLKFYCQPKWVYFSDACGCGCEKTS
jgi:hypothetical protein